MFIKHLALMNPVQFIASTSIKFLIKRFALPETLLGLFTVLFHTSYKLIRTQGIYSVFRVLVDIKNFIGSYEGTPNNALPRLIQILNERHSPFIATKFINELAPILHKCLPVGTSVYVIFNYFLVGLFTTVLKPIIKYTFKFTAALILGSLGVIWHESLSSISYLRDFSLNILDYIEHHTNFKFPKVDKDLVPTKETINPIHVSNIEVTNDTIQEVNNTATLFTICSILLIGVVGAVSLIVVSDYYAHETVKDIPVINTVSDSIHSIWNSISNFYHSINFNQSDNPGSGSNLPDAISRVSSGDSDKTITNLGEQIITPPSTRPSTPVPNDNY